jgi:membrane-bound lytic murein transglycosylase B
MRVLHRVCAIGGVMIVVGACSSVSGLDPATTQSFATAAPSEWSGQPGASGHPDMSAESIRSAAANFSHCIEELWPQAARRGITPATFDTHARRLTPDMRIMDLVDAQPEFTKSFWDYLDLLVTDERVQRGRELLQRHRATFDAVEKRYGVDRHILAAVWGVETKYGAAAGDRPVLRSTATLACIGRRQEYFRNEFLAALELVQRGDIAPENFKGSWAGAFGGTQFMPTTFKRFAVDFDGDGRRDTVSSVADLMASTAHMFRQNGWVSGQTWGYEVVIPKDFDYLHADKSRELTLREWQHRGLRRADGQAFPRPNDRAYLFIPAGAQGPAFLMLGNFRVIMKYNPAEAYALAIGHLADRLRGGTAFVQAWPRHERVLSLAERAEMQQLLARRGFDVGEADGRFGAKTRAAIREFQARAGLVPDGFASATVLERLRKS